MRITQKNYSIVKNKNTGKVEFKDWQENQVSTLTYFYIAKYLGTLLGGNSAKVTFFYENGNVKELFGPDGDVYHFAKKIIFQKKNEKAKFEMLEAFDATWKSTKPTSRYYYGRPLQRSARKKSGIMQLLDQVPSDKFQISSGDLLKSKLAERKITPEQLAENLDRNKSSIYTHIKGERALSKDAAIEYSKILGCDPVDLMFDKKTIEVWGTTSFLKRSLNGLVMPQKDGKFVTVPRDFYSPSIRAVQYDNVGSIYTGKTFFYYKDNERKLETENKLCFVGVVQEDEIDDYVSFYVGVYETHQGKHNLINPEPFARERYILQDFDVAFVTPIVAVVDAEAAIDNTSKRSNVPEHLFYEQETKEKELALLKMKYEDAFKHALENEKKYQKIQKDFAREKAQLEAQMQETNKLIADEIKKQEQRILQYRDEVFKQEEELKRA